MASSASPTAANTSSAVPTPTAADISYLASMPMLPPEDRDDVLNMITDTKSPLANIVAEFLARFPLEHRRHVNALLRVFLEDKCLVPEGRVIALAILYGSLSSQPENPNFQFMMNIACDETVRYSERVFIQHLLTKPCEESSKVLQLSSAEYVKGSLLVSKDLLPREQLEKRAMTKEKALARLKHLCHILGRNYNDKLSEFGTDEPDRERVISSIEILEVTVKKNYTMLKTAGEELLGEWKASGTPFNKMANFYWVMMIHDTESVEDISGYNYLSNDAVRKAKNELFTLRTERLKKWKTKYLAKKKKLIKLLKEIHIECDYIGFDPSGEVEPENYRTEKKRLKDMIDSVKLLGKERKELILRVELLRRSVMSKSGLEAVKAMHSKAVDAAEEIGGGSSPYDSKAVEDVLKDLLESSERDAAIQHGEVNVKANVSTTSKTRSGRTFPISN